MGLIIAICGIGIILTAFGFRNAKDSTFCILIVVAEVALMVFSLTHESMNIGVFLAMQALIGLTWSLWKIGRKNYKLPFTK